jgi:thioredoxin 1
MTMAEIIITKSNFKTDVEESKLPVLVDFWAAWCGPCRMMAPHVEKLAEEMDGKIVVGTVDIDDQQELAQQFGVMSIPTFILFVDGKPANKMVGADIGGLNNLVAAYK